MTCVSRLLAGVLTTFDSSGNNRHAARCYDVVVLSRVMLAQSRYAVSGGRQDLTAGRISMIPTGFRDISLGHGSLGRCQMSLQSLALRWPSGIANQGGSRRTRRAPDGVLCLVTPLALTVARAILPPCRNQSILKGWFIRDRLRLRLISVRFYPLGLGVPIRSRNCLQLHPFSTKSIPTIIAHWTSQMSSCSLLLSFQPLTI